MNSTNGANKLGCVSEHISEMQTDDGSLLSMKEEDTIESRFSPDFYSNLTSSSSILYDRQLGDGAAFLSELAFTLKSKSCRLDDDEKLFEEKFCENLSNRERDRYMVAKNQFQNYQYLAAVQTLDADICHSRKSNFLRFYAEFKYLIRSASEEMHDETSVADCGVLLSHPDFDSLRRRMEEKSELGQLDAFGIYLYGLVLSAAREKVKARKQLTEAIKRFPFLWPAWKALLNCLPNSLEVLIKDLPFKCDLINFFSIECSVRTGEDLDECIDRLNEMLEMFPNNKWIHAMLGEAYALDRNTDASIIAFEKMRQIDPNRIENMDTLSNQYYMSARRSELAILVHEMWKIDKYRPETCIATANYYSLREERATAIEYFERALKLKPNFLGAWTLIGHEYVELRNFSQAINAYRMAISGNQSDYRAWYGLGQAYENLKLYSYALTNYMKASNIKPNDDRVWIALGDTYTQLDNLGFAKRYYKRAVKLRGNCLAQALEKIARLCEKQKQEGKAAKYWEKYLNCMEEDEGTDERDDGYCDAYVYLSSYYIENKIDLCLGEEYAKKCVQFLPTREHGTKLLNILKSADGSTEAKEEIRRPDPIGAESVPQPFEKSIEMPSAGEGANGQPKGESADGRPLTWMEYVKSELSKSDSTDTN